MRLPSEGRGQRYATHDNGGRPFEVTVEGAAVCVHALRVDGKALVYACPRAEKVWIGEDPARPSAAFSGNSILVEETAGEGQYSYVWVSADIRRFRTQSRIIEFVSSVWGSDVAYPYAVDAAGTHYLFNEKVTVTNLRASQPTGHPYNIFYDLSTIVGGDQERSPYERYYVGKRSCTLTSGLQRLHPSVRGKPRYLLRRGAAERERVSMAQLRTIMDEWNEAHGIARLNTEVLVWRDGECQEDEHGTPDGEGEGDTEGGESENEDVDGGEDTRGILVQHYDILAGQ